MSMSFSYVAVTADAQSVEDALFALCPEFYIMERQPQLGTFVQMYGYCHSRSGYLNGLHPSDVKAFCQHQGWCIIIDFSLLLPEDNKVLSSLSTQFGKVVTAVTHSTSRTAYFALFESGEMKRRILSSNGKIMAKGEPLPEEAGGEGNDFYVAELDRLWQAYGLPPFMARLSGPYAAVHYLDNNEESVEKGIEEIAERTRQYEELEAMKARQRNQPEATDFAPPADSQPVTAAEIQPNNMLATADDIDSLPNQATATQTDGPALIGALLSDDSSDGASHTDEKAQKQEQERDEEGKEKVEEKHIAKQEEKIEAESGERSEERFDKESEKEEQEEKEEKEEKEEDNDDDDEDAEKPQDKPWWKLW